MRKEYKTRSVYAKALTSPLFRMRVVTPKRGKGSYKRLKPNKLES